MDLPVYNPAMPYVAPIMGGFNPGRMLRIQGSAHPTARCFSINLQCGPNVNPRDDIALHLSPVFSPPPRVVRNSLQLQVWGPEESHGMYFPFSPGQSWEVLILSEPDHFKIAINGQHFTEFYYRLPLQRVTFLAIDGETTISMLQFSGNAMAPGYGSPYGSGVPSPSGAFPPPMGGASPYSSGSSPNPYSSPYPPPPSPAYAGQGSPYMGQRAPSPSPYPVVGQGYPVGQQQVGYPHSPSHGSKGLMGSTGLLGAGLGAAAGVLAGKKASKAIPIGLGVGAGALAGTALLGGHLKPKKMKKLFKHKHKHKGWGHKGWGHKWGHKHKWGGGHKWGGRSSSSSD